MGPESPLQVFPFSRSAGEIEQLRDCCRLWREGPERFWAFDDVLAALGRPGSLGLFAAERRDSEWGGVVLADIGPFTADLLYVYAKPEWRRRGVGHALIRALLTELGARPAIEAVFLEVRVSNDGAQALYQRHGFAVVGRRKSYYANGEDAQVYRYEFKRPAPG